MSTNPPRWAVVSVFKKTGLIDIAAALHRHDIEIISTGGTAKAIRDAGIPVIEVSEFTGFPEIFDGRLKTIHPKIAGGLLFDRSKPDHMKQARENGIVPIDFLIVSLYDFQGNVKEDTPIKEAIEFIDVGGPGMIRGAAKNFESVTVASCPADYSEIIRQLDQNRGETTYDLRLGLAVRVFSATQLHDGEIYRRLSAELDEMIRRKAERKAAAV